MTSDPGSRPEDSLGGPPEERFADSVRPVQGKLVSVARRILGRDDLAWEAVQEALVSLWLEKAPPPNPRAWLMHAVIYRSLHLARTDRRRRKHERLACHHRHEASSRDDPTAPVLAQEMRGMLMAALGKLVDKHRLVLTLHLIDGLDYESIARKLGIPVGTVRSRLSRAREALRATISLALSEDNAIEDRNPGGTTHP